MLRRVIYLSLLIVFLSVTPTYSFWIWTPKTGRWINPKYAVKPTPPEQLEFALEVYQSGNFKRAKVEFKKLIKYYPRSFEASEAQYYLGLIEEKLDRLYEAYLAYQTVVDKYPFSERIQEVIEREYKIAEAFMSGRRRKLMGVTLPVENPAIEIFKKVVENSTYGRLAPSAQYKLGLVLMNLGRFYEAEEEFQKVITHYPQSEWVNAARYQIASAKAASSKGTDYDHEAVAEAKEMFEKFVKEHPDATLTPEAKESLRDLKEKEAKSNYDIAYFYEKQKAHKAAEKYYNLVIDNYPQSEWAVKSVERIEIIEKRKK